MTDIKDMPHVTVEQVLALRKAAMQLQAESEKLIEALGRIARWNEIGLKKRCDIGSNGVRDHYIAIAQKALKQTTKGE